MNTQKELKTENIEKYATTETLETPYIYIYTEEESYTAVKQLQKCHQRNQKHQKKNNRCNSKKR